MEEGLGKAAVAEIFGAVGTIALGIVLLVAGIVGQRAEAVHSALCNSGLGQLSQAVSGKTAVDCGVATFIETMGPICKILGIIAIVGCVLGIVFVLIVAVNSRSASQLTAATRSQPAKVSPESIASIKSTARSIKSTASKEEDTGGAAAGGAAAGSNAAD